MTDKEKMEKELKELEGKGEELIKKHESSLIGEVKNENARAAIMNMKHIKERGFGCWM